MEGRGRRAEGRRGEARLGEARRGETREKGAERSGGDGTGWEEREGKQRAAHCFSMMHACRVCILLMAGFNDDTCLD